MIVPEREGGKREESRSWNQTPVTATDRTTDTATVTSRESQLRSSQRLDSVEPLSPGPVRD